MLETLSNEGAAAVLESDATETAALERYCFFARGPQKFALPASCIQEIVKPGPLTSLPQTSSSLAGLMNLRSQVLPVVLPDQWLLTPPRSFDKTLPLLVIRHGKSLFAMQLDSVDGVLPLASSSLIPHPFANRRDYFSQLIVMQGVPYASLLKIDYLVEQIGNLCVR